MKGHSAQILFLIVFFLCPVLTWGNDHEIAVTLDNGFVRPLGVGYDGQAEEYRAVCVSGMPSNQVEHQNTINHGTINLSLEADQKSVARKLGFSAGGKGRVGVIEASASASYLNESKEGGLSLSFNYSSEYLSSSYLVNTTTHPVELAPGMAPLLTDPIAWKRTCGDEFAYLQEMGARLLVNMRVDFVSKEERTNFEAMFAVSGPLFSANGQFQTDSSQFSKNTKLTISAIQMGGDPSYLGTVFAGAAGTGSDDPRKVISCSFGELNHCIDVMANIVKYGNTQEGNSFPVQIRDFNRYTLLKLRTKPWTYLGSQFPAPPSGEELQAASVNLQEVQNLFEENYDHWIQASRYWRNNVPRLSEDCPGGVLGQRSKMKGLQEKFRDYLTRIAIGVRSCYDHPNQCAITLADLRRDLGVGTPAYLGQSAIDALLVPETYAQFCDQIHSNRDLKTTILALDKIAFSNSGVATRGEWESGDQCKKAENVLSRMTSLKLEGEGLSDLRPISALPALKTLDLSRNEIVELQELRKLKNLEELNLNHNRIQDVAPLAEIPTLEKIYLQGNRLNIVDPLSRLQNLKLLDVRRNLKPLSCPLTRTSICKVEDLSEATQFLEINCAGSLSGCIGMSASGVANKQIVFAGGRTKQEDQKSEVYVLDSLSLKWKRGNDLHVPRAGHTVTLLDGDQDLLLVGGDRFSSYFEVYSLNATHSNHIRAFGRLKYPRFGHTATKLSDGRVLIAGGYVNGLIPAIVRDDSTPTGEIFDPVSGDTTETGSSMTQPKSYHSAVLLNDGRVFISGGISGSTVSSRVEVFGTIGGLQKFQRFAGVTLKEARFYHTMTKLPDGKVLIAGGFGKDWKALSTVELFDPTTSTVTQLPSMDEPRGAHFAVLLEDRYVLISGGGSEFKGGLSAQLDLNGKAAATSELYDIAGQRFINAASMKHPRAFHSACIALGDGECKVFLSPGMGTPESASSFEVFDWGDL